MICLSFPLHQVHEKFWCEMIYLNGYIQIFVLGNVISFRATSIMYAYLFVYYTSKNSWPHSLYSRLHRSMFWENVNRSAFPPPPPFLFFFFFFMGPQSQKGGASLLTCIQVVGYTLIMEQHLASEIYCTRTWTPGAGFKPGIYINYKTALRGVGYTVL